MSKQKTRHLIHVTSDNIRLVMNKNTKKFHMRDVSDVSDAEWDRLVEGVRNGTGGADYKDSREFDHYTNSPEIMHVMG